MAKGDGSRPSLHLLGGGAIGVDGKRVGLRGMDRATAERER